MVIAEIGLNHLGDYKEVKSYLNTLLNTKVEGIEFHVTHDRTDYGSDQAASIENIGGMVQSIRNMEQMLGDGRKVVYETEKPIAAKLRKVNNIVE